MEEKLAAGEALAEEVDMKVALKEHLEKNDKFAILRKEWSIEER